MSGSVRVDFNSTGVTVSQNTDIVTLTKAQALTLAQTIQAKYKEAKS